MRKRISVGLQNAAIVLVLIVVTFPFLWVFLASFKPKQEVYAYPPKFIFRPTFENYTQALIRERFYTHFIDSAVVTVASTSVALAAGSLVAYGIARHRLGGTPLRFFLLAMRTLPAIAIVIPIYTMFRELRLLDTYWALILVYPVYMTPLVAWIMVGFFREIPREMEEAALIDGCSQWGLFWRVVVPVAAPGLVAVAILNFIGGWNEFLFSLILTSRNVQTTPVAAAGFSTNKGILWGEMAAVGVTASIPVIAFALIVQKRLVRGLTLGAVQ